MSALKIAMAMLVAFLLLTLFTQLPDYIIGPRGDLFVFILLAVFAAVVIMAVKK